MFTESPQGGRRANRADPEVEDEVAPVGSPVRLGRDRQRRVCFLRTQQCVDYVYDAMFVFCGCCSDPRRNVTAGSLFSELCSFLESLILAQDERWRRA
jgi:hypothetical protein